MIFTFCFQNDIKIMNQVDFFPFSQIKYKGNTMYIICNLLSFANMGMAIFAVYAAKGGRG